MGWEASGCGWLLAGGRQVKPGTNRGWNAQRDRHLKGDLSSVSPDTRFTGRHEDFVDPKKPPKDRCQLIRSTPYL